MKGLAHRFFFSLPGSVLPFFTLGGLDLPKGGFMKALMGAILLLASVSTAFAAPDPRDSIILESKIVIPGRHLGSSGDTSSYLYVGVWITNKDTIVGMNTSLEIRSTSGGAFIILARPRSFNGTLDRPTNSFGGPVAQSFAPLANSQSPDSARWFGAFDPLDENTKEPPNATRKLFWQIKFDTVLANLGTVEIDSIKLFTSSTVNFFGPNSQQIEVNFVKSILTVALKGDMNLDGMLTPTDAVAHLTCVFLGNDPPSGTETCDFNCDGLGTPSDVILLWNSIFFGDPFPC